LDQSVSTGVARTAPPVMGLLPPGQFNLLRFRFRPPKPAVIVVDPVDEGVVEACMARRVRVVPLWSVPYATGAARSGHGLSELIKGIDCRQELSPPRGYELKWARNALRGLRLEGVVCGSDAGLATAERLQHALLPYRSNGENPSRRDKLLMNEAIKDAGLESAMQIAPSSWSAAEAFLELLPRPLRVVLKPRRGQGGLGVLKATSVEEVKYYYDSLIGADVSLDNDEAPKAPVIQEFLEGEEWVVDTVSRDSEHKAVALWRYDKGPANGAPFVYFCDELMPMASEKERQLAEYAFKVLDAIGWKWGAAHIELKVTPSRGPVLVEVNAGRCNGVDFRMIVDLCIGYNAYDALLDAYTDEVAWQELPRLPPATLRASGRLVKLVSSVEGRLRALRHVAEVETMPSLFSFQPGYTEPGDIVRMTHDLTTAAGFATLIYPDEHVVRADYERLRGLQSTMFEVDSIHCRNDATHPVVAELLL